MDDPNDTPDTPEAETPEAAPEGDTPTVVGITTDVLDTLLGALEDGNPVDAALKDFLTDKRDVLLGLSANALKKLFDSIAADPDSTLLNAKREFIDSLPTMAMVNEYHAKSLAELEASAEAPLKIGSFLRSVLDYGKEIAPRLVTLLAGVIGI